MPMQDNEQGEQVFVCGTCGSPAIETWPFVHCYKCGAREDRPDLGQNADGSIMENQGVAVVNPGGNAGSDPGADVNADPAYTGGDPVTDPTGDLP